MHCNDDLAEREPFFCRIPVVINASDDMIVRSIGVSKCVMRGIINRSDEEEVEVLDEEESKVSKKYRISLSTEE